MIRSGDRIPTGTGPDRRRLTLAEAEAGGLPEPFTRDEWAAMYHRSQTLHNWCVQDSAEFLHRPHPNERT